MSSLALPYTPGGASPTHAAVPSRLGRALAATVTPERVYALAVTALVFIIAVQRPAGDPDLGWHLRAGEIACRDWWPPHADEFSYTRPGAPWIAYSWLAEVAMWLLASHVGFHALRIAAAGLIGFTFLLVFRSCRRAGASVAATTAVVACGGLATLWFVSERPTLVSFVLAAVWMDALARHRRGEEVRLWHLVPLTAVWANVHVFFVFGLAWLWLAAGWALLERLAGADTPAARDWLRLAIVALACTVATAVNPWGPALLLHMREIASHPATLPIVELASPNFHHESGPYLLAIVLLVFATFAWSPERPDSFVFALVVVHLALALYVQRNVPLLVIVAAPAAARAATLALPRWLADPPRRSLSPPHVVAHLLAMGMIVGIVAVHLPTRPGFEDNLPPKTYPVEAVRFLHAQPRLGRMFNGFNWGGFLIYALYPDYQVAMDGRATFYGEENVLGYMKLSHVRPDWRRQLARLRPDFIIWERGDALARSLADHKGWVRVYADDVAVIFVRRSHPLRRHLERAGHDWVNPPPQAT